MWKPIRNLKNRFIDFIAILLVIAIIPVFLATHTELVSFLLNTLYAVVAFVWNILTNLVFQIALAGAFLIWFWHRVKGGNKAMGEEKKYTKSEYIWGMVLASIVSAILSRLF